MALSSEASRLFAQTIRSPFVCAPRQSKLGLAAAIR
jgi:hypothetical protein